MNECIIDNWNDVVKKGDRVFVIGDFGFGKLDNVINKLNGNIVLILGDHDKSALSYKDKFTKITPLLNTKIKGVYITLCHWQMYLWAKSHYGSICLYGHCHGNSTPFGKSMDVGVDTNNYKLYSFDEIMSIMETKPDNVNLLPHLKEQK